MKPATAEKPASGKTSRSSAKVFDVSHPGKGTASATSRPVIVSNRPMLQDPMVSSTSETEIKEPKLSPVALKVTINPPEENSGDMTGEKSDKDKKSDPARTIAELAAQAAADKPNENSDENSKEILDTQPSEESEAEDTTSGDASNDISTDEKPDEPRVKPDTSIPGSSPSEEINVEASKEAKEIAALEAEAKKQEAIEALVDGKQYILPINAVEQHRSVVVAVLGLVLIITLGLALFDLLLDVGFVRINGVHSVTHFFSA